MNLVTGWWRAVRSNGWHLYGVGLLLTLLLVFVGTQIAVWVGQDVNWYTGFGSWLGAIASVFAAVVALGIATSDRRRADRQRTIDSDERNEALRRQASLVRATATHGDLIKVCNWRSSRIFNIEITNVDIGGSNRLKTIGSIRVRMNDGSDQISWWRTPLETLVLKPNQEAWIAVELAERYRLDTADKVAVRYNDEAGRSWEIDSRGRCHAIHLK
ncbi:hypothetical protein FZI91_21805 [Mycobacterium sp. CBMA271]|uniref:hypothetical protein n=1 Tax=unclassified Mycobacteroides TaxID=2618759 RepID=UPI0012DD4A4C|nr:MULTISPECIES: hypothetical protein [unclassified Mycobacteroides]MUM19715.1 hypothetical protein [Mycobacteroides sp. CBMA 326]MUM24319.1 hypothetical protein [Mycobacteroides sp. CBMA 271]